MRRFLAGTLSLLVMAGIFTAMQPREAEARRGGAIAAGVALGIIGGVILHHALRNNRRHHYRSYYYRPRYRTYYHRPRYRYRVYHRHPRRCIWRHGYRYCRY